MLFGIPQHWLTLAFVGSIASGVAAQQVSSTLAGFDPGAAVSMLTDASANEGAASNPFVGLASAVVVDPLYGTATTSIPIDIPSGRKGLTPDLTLRYSSNAGNSSFGIGWDLTLGCLKRNTAAGVPLDFTQATSMYDDAKGFVLVFRGGTIVLDKCLSPGGDPSTCTAWGASSEETWLTVTYNRTGNSWVVVDVSGTIHTYGAAQGTGSDAARMGIDASVPQRTFVWLLTDVQDANNNSIRIEYAEKIGVHAYPRFIHYGGNATAGLPHTFHVELVTSSRDDVAEGYRAGFVDWIESLTTRIRVRVDGVAANPVTEYLLTYTLRWSPFFGQVGKLKSLRRSEEEERWRSANSTVGNSRRRWCCRL